MTVRCDGEKISEGGREKGGELLFGEEFEEGRLMVVEGALKGC